MDPVGSIVPLVQGVPDVLAPEDPAEVTIVVQEGIFFADHQDDVHPAQGIQPPAVETGQVVDRRMVVEVLVPVAVEQIAKGLQVQGRIIAAGEGAERLKKPLSSDNNLRSSAALSGCSKCPALSTNSSLGPGSAL